MLEQCAKDGSDNDVAGSCKSIHRHGQWSDLGNFRESRELDTNEGRISRTA